MTTATRTPPHATEREILSALTVEDALNLLQIAVDERGEDYVYRGDKRDAYGGVSCDYAEEDGSPSCLIGLALSVIGVDPLWLQEEGENEYAGAGISNLGPEIGLSFAVTEAFTAAQSAQDSGKPWGRALESARAAASLSR